jgi:hypothetical protein
MVGSREEVLELSEANNSESNLNYTFSLSLTTTHTLMLHILMSHQVASNLGLCIPNRSLIRNLGLVRDSATTNYPSRWGPTIATKKLKPAMDVAFLI